MKNIFGLLVGGALLLILGGEVLAAPMTILPVLPKEPKPVKIMPVLPKEPKPVKIMPVLPK